MKLIREQVEDIEYLVEEKGGQKHRYITGIFMQAEKQNRNGRVYPFQTLNREVQRYNTEYVQKNRAFGELGHPDSPSINLDRVSHMITSLKADGNNFIGKARIVANLGVSTRGVGSLKPHNGYQLVQDDFKLATAADIVADPSAPDAFVQGIMENVDWVWENGVWKQSSLEFAKKQIQTASKNDLEAVALRIFENFVSKI
jgi:hypothetical protein